MLHSHSVPSKLREIRKQGTLGNISPTNGLRMIIKKSMMRFTDILLKTLPGLKLERKLNRKIWMLKRLGWMLPMPKDIINLDWIFLCLMDGLEIVMLKTGKLMASHVKVSLIAEIGDLL